MTPEDIKTVVEQVLASQALTQERLRMTLEAADKEIQNLQQQLADKDKLIASQEKTVASLEEILGLLRGGEQPAELTHSLMKAPSALFCFLLACAAGCTKQSDLPTAAPPADWGSYHMAGKLVKCQVSATTSWKYGINSLSMTVDSTELVSVELHTSSPTPTDSAALLLTYERPSGRSATPYELSMAFYLSGVRTDAPVIFDHLVGTLHEVSPGIISGTFANIESKQPTISEGSFTNVRIYPYTQPEPKSYFIMPSR